LPYGALAVVALLPTACSSARLGAAAALVEMTAAFNEGTKILKTLTDEATAKEAAARLEPVAKKCEAAARHYKYSVRRGRSSGDLNTELQKNLKATMTIMAEMNRVERIPGAMRHVKPLVDRMDEALQE
jgi:hypothetical protein